MEISNNTLYRTSYIVDSAARGFSTTSKWDEASYSQTRVELFATNSTRAEAKPNPTLTVPPSDS
ncbi:MAG: hypothetical protein ACRCY4_05495 [Brevinema sp.]